MHEVDFANSGKHLDAEPKLDGLRDDITRDVLAIMAYAEVQPWVGFLVIAKF